MIFHCKHAVRKGLAHAMTALHSRPCHAMLKLIQCFETCMLLLLHNNNATIDCVVAYAQKFKLNNNNNNNNNCIQCPTTTVATLTAF